jgi:ankyrin repeat protein
MLLEKGMTIEPDNYRRTPMMLAIRNNHNDIFFSLFNVSTKYYRRDFSHNTLLHYAAAYGNVEVVKYLLETKLNLQTPNKKNFYPYEIAVLKGHYQCAKLL